MSRRKKTARAQAIVGPTPLEQALVRFKPLLSADEFTELLAELEKPLPQALRVNPLKNAHSLDSVEKWATRYGWQVQPVAFCPSGWLILSNRTAPSHTPEQRLGFYYIQDAASMLPVELFDFDLLPQNPLILDMAASPGGKTTHLVSNTLDRGLVIANDSSADRLMALRLVLQNWGAINTAVTHFPGERFGSWLPERFDAVLLDAPCSMQSLRSIEGHSMHAITPREHKDITQRQQRLIISAFQTLKVGGQLVYSTCSLSPEEDEAIVDDLLCLFPGQVRVEAPTRLPKPAPGLLSDGSRSFDPSVEHSVRLWPQRYGTAGFFAARVTKLVSVPNVAGDPPSRPWERSGLESMSAKNCRLLVEQIQQNYSFDLGPTQEAQNLSLFQRQNQVFAIPQQLLESFPDLPVQAAGMLLGELNPMGFRPSHEFTARFGMHFNRGVILLPEEALPGWLRGEDVWVSMEQGLPVGQVLAVRDTSERLLGNGKLLANGKLKNLLPRRILFQ